MSPPPQGSEMSPPPGMFFGGPPPGFMGQPGVGGFPGGGFPPGNDATTRDDATTWHAPALPRDAATAVHTGTSAVAIRGHADATAIVRPRRAPEFARDGDESEWRRGAHAASSPPSSPSPTPQDGPGGERPRRDGQLVPPNPALRQVILDLKKKMELKYGDANFSPDEKRGRSSTYYVPPGPPPTDEPRGTKRARAEDLF
ncbi:hypothetical protein FIBSPDRAFT_926114 [Athelia psychrophila]|uniref:Uncharacterized protein n=1 Tax=Athelia psychrophila TaxID=1759441 RepID=A0A166TVS2_9AGAM|nr:hypothetical protein FIBSPDRAFT_926114 [Fibularhizoctonia sp. CBS 109695]